MSHPLVSVVTPVLNAVDTLEIALRSVAAQTYPNVEHIVIDGGSSDGTTEVLRRFRSRVPLRWVSERDAGMYAAINKGIELAQGEILSYLNSDDIYVPWSVRSAVSGLGSSAADVAFGDLVVLLKRRGAARNARIQFYPRFHTRVYAHEISMGQPSVFWRRRVTDAVGAFDESLRYAGDFEYWLRMGIAGYRYTHIREVLAIAVEHEAALSTVRIAELQREIDDVRTRYGDLVPARRYQRLHALTRLMHWRGQVLAFRWNLRRASPSAWQNFIRFIRETGLNADGSRTVRLLLPLPLPESWSLWRLDPVAFEREVIASLTPRSSIPG